MIKIHLENEIKLCKKHYLNCRDVILKRIERKLEKGSFSEYFGLLNYIKKRLEDIITNKPNGLADIYNEFISQFHHILKSEKNDNETDDLINKILNYKSFSTKATSSTKWDAYKLAEALNVSVCPYCNRIYTNTVTKDEKKIVRPDFDHFFPKSLYPLFQMSFYNLIPSCTICNSRLKLHYDLAPEKLNEFIHPYLDEFGKDGRFTYKNTIKDESSSIYSKENIRIEITNSKFQKLDDCKLQVKNNCEMFKIEEIYQMHTDIVSEMIYDFNVYNDIYIEFLRSFDSLGLSKGEIYKIAFRNFYDPKDFQKRPLSKLTRDIYDELSG